MYDYVSAKVKSRTGRGTWKEQDVSSLTLEQIDKEFIEVHFTLRSSADNAIRFTTLTNLKKLGIIYSMTIVQWLSHIGSRAIEVYTTPFEIEKKTARYRDALAAGFNFKLVGHNTHPDVPLPISDRNDIYLTKTGINPEHAGNTTLVSINGLFHYSTSGYNGLVVYEGGRSIMRSGKNGIGILNLEDVGTVEKILLEEGMFFKPHADVKASEAMYFKLGEPLTGKTLLLVIGGYLHILDDVYQVISDENGIVKVNINKIALAQRIFESRDLINLSTLNIHTTQVNQGLIETQALYSEENLLAYMTLPQSFAVIVDTPDLYVEEHPAEKANLPGLFYSSDVPKLPLKTRTGRMPEYWVKREDQTFVCYIDDNLSKNYVFEASDKDELLYLSETLVPGRKYGYSIAHWVEIGKATVTPS